MTRQGWIHWVALVILMWSPHILLDFTYYIHGVIRGIPDAAEIFFILTLLSGVVFARAVGASALEIFKSRWLQLCLAAFLVGTLLSSQAWQSYRLIAIIGVISLSAGLAAVWVASLDRRRQWIAFVIIFMPFWATNFLGLFMEVLEIYGMALPIDHTKMAYFAPPRWQTLHTAANGFGFDAAVVTVSGLFGAIWSRSPLGKAAFLLVMVAGLLCVYFSGTRAAMLFVLGAGALLIVKDIPARLIMLAVPFVVGFLVVAVLLVGIENILSYLRITENIQFTTSNRLQGFIGLVDLVARSPFAGVGFGAADGSITVQPSNMFYPGMMAEIGLIGAAGVFGAMLYPMVAGRLARPRQISAAPSGSPNVIQQVASAILVGIFIWLLFEFDVVRVSATNQLFVFFWTLKCMQATKAEHAV